MYLSTTRPDITYSVSYLSRFLDKQTSETWKADKNVTIFTGNKRSYVKDDQSKTILLKACSD